MSFSILLPLIGISFLAVITWASYTLGEKKTEDPKKAAIIGFLLAFIPPFALIYLVVLLLKEDVGIV